MLTVPLGSSRSRAGDWPSEQGAGVYFDGLGTFSVWSLPGADATGTGWTVTGSGVEIERGVGGRARR